MTKDEIDFTYSTVIFVESTQIYQIEKPCRLWLRWNLQACRHKKILNNTMLIFLILIIYLLQIHNKKKSLVLYNLLAIADTPLERWGTWPLQTWCKIPGARLFMSKVKRQIKQYQLTSRDTLLLSCHLSNWWTSILCPFSFLPS